MGVGGGVHGDGGGEHTRPKALIASGSGKQPLSEEVLTTAEGEGVAVGVTRGIALKPCSWLQEVSVADGLDENRGTVVDLARGIASTPGLLSWLHEVTVSACLDDGAIGIALAPLS